MLLKTQPFSYPLILSTVEPRNYDHHLGTKKIAVVVMQGSTVLSILLL